MEMLERIPRHPSACQITHARNLTQMAFKWSHLGILHHFVHVFQYCCYSSECIVKRYEKWLKNILFFSLWTRITFVNESLRTLLKIDLCLPPSSPLQSLLPYWSLVIITLGWCWQGFTIILRIQWVVLHNKIIVNFHFLLTNFFFTLRRNYYSAL